MVLYLREEHVRELLTMPEAIKAVEHSMKDQGDGDAVVYPRTRLKAGDAFFQMMPAVMPHAGGMGFKIYAGSAGGRAKPLVTYYDAQTGQLAALIEAAALGQIRTGAASGVATKYQAREDAKTVAVIGSGYQARTQLEAVCAVRPITKAVVFSRNPENRMQFAQRLAPRLGIEIVPAETAAEAVAGADIVITMTNANTPVLLGSMLEPGQHINAAGANSILRRELDEEAVRRAAVITVDDMEQAKLECGDIAIAVERGLINWEMAIEIGDVVAGRAKGRTSAEDITLFESHGIGLWDIAAASVVYKAARARGLGDELPI